jgi:hypothetical protein
MCAPVGSTSSVPLENSDFGQYSVLKTNESFTVTLYKPNLAYVYAKVPNNKKNVLSESNAVVEWIMLLLSGDPYFKISAQRLAIMMFAVSSVCSGKCRGRI